MKTYQFCPFDAEKLVEKEVGGKNRKTCLKCGYVDFQNARAGSFVLAQNDKAEFVFIKRAVEPFKGYWDAPGGFVDGGEDPESAAIREAKEETGYDVEIIRLIGVGQGFYEDPKQGSFPTLHFGYLAKITGGEPKGDYESSEIKFFPRNEFPEIPFGGDKQVIQMYLEGR